MSLSYQLAKLVERQKEDSFGTRAVRKRTLKMCAKQLQEMGYRKMRPESIKPKHVDKLLERWRTEGLSVGTIKNRMSAIRWWARKVNKPGILAADNAAYGIPERQSNRENKGQDLDMQKLAQVTDDHVRASLMLQAAFGLRREEAIKFSPSYADHGVEIQLKGSWTKGGRSRSIPIETKEQREALAYAHKVAGKGSLIPSARKYVEQLHKYGNQTTRVGLCKNHGLRHRFAQRQYEARTGWKPPALGGPARKQLTREQREIDKAVRLEISRLLGHNRIEITAVYLGG